MSNTLRTEMPDAEILQELGRRLQALRKSRRLSQAEAAELSGIARRTLYSAEQGDNPTMLTVIRLLRTYGRLGSLDSFIPVPEVSPLEIIDRLESRRG
jgi:transcriptional regulator with XRE-family HTH domain